MDCFQILLSNFAFKFCFQIQLAALQVGNQNGDIASAVDLPYFDGDYFPGVAEDWIPGRGAHSSTSRLNLSRF